MKPNRLMIYSFLLLALIGVAVYRTATGPDPSEPPDVQIELTREGAKPGALKEPAGPLGRSKDFDGDDPRRIVYSYDISVEKILAARCFTCHAREEKVGVDLHFYDYDTVMELVIPGDLSSPIPASVARDGSMFEYLTIGEANLIREWVIDGARQ